MVGKDGETVAQAIAAMGDEGAQCLSRQVVRPQERPDHRRGGFPPDRKSEEQGLTKSNEPPRPSFDREAYRRRNLVERLINKLKHFRRVATRYEKRAENFLAMVK